MADDKTIVGEQPIKAQGVETVTITKGQLDGLLARLENLEVGRGIKKPKRVTEHEAYLRFYKEKPVVKLSNHKEMCDNFGKIRGFVDLTLLGADKPEIAEYLPFLNESNQVKVKILSQKAEEVVITQGKTRAQNPDPLNDKKFESGEIDLEVTSYQYTAEVEVIEGEHMGEKYTLDTRALNI